MARARRRKGDIPEIAKLGAFFVVIGAVLGLIRGDGLGLGIMAGALIFATVIGIGTFAEFVRRLLKT